MEPPGPLREQLEDSGLATLCLLMEAHAHLVRLLGDELEAARGIPLTWFDVLISLARSEGHRLTMSELGSQIFLTSGGVTRLVDRIAEAGLVERQHCPTDRRSVFVALTPRGQAELEGALTVQIEGTRRHLLDRLTEEERQELDRALRKLAGGAPATGCC